MTAWGGGDKGVTMSTVKANRISASKVRLDIVAEAHEVDEAIRFADTIVSRLKERPLGEKQLGVDPEKTARNAVLSRATRSIVESTVERAVHDEGLRLVKQPSLSLDKLVTEGQPFSFSVEIDTVPLLRLSDYSNLSVEVDYDFDVTDEDVDDRLEEIRQRCVEVKKDSQDPISDLDLVELSFESFIDGKPYEGSVVKDMMYEMGSGNLPDEFEQGLLGMKTGEEKTIEFVVPDDFANEQIAGKNARFDVKVGRVAARSLPDIDEAFAKDFGYESLDFWRKKIAGELAQQREADYDGAKEAAARKALADCLLDDVDQDFVNARAEQMFQAFATDLRKQGVSFEEYKQYLQITDEDIRAEMREEAAHMVRENLALESLFENEGMSLSDADVQKTADELAEESGSPSIPLAEFTKEQQIAIREMTMHRMATEWLLEHVQFV